MGQTPVGAVPFEYFPLTSKGWKFCQAGALIIWYTKDAGLRTDREVGFEILSLFKIKY